MDIDRLQEKERRDVMAQMADLYYNQGKTQSEIAAHFGTNRFRVARMIQEAREERIVEIRIYFSDERNKALEEELKKCLKLKDVLVVNTRRSSYIDGLAQIGEAGADYLARILEQGAYLGVLWGKTLHSVISRLPDMHYHPVTAVQLAGYFPMTNPAVDSRELTRMAALKCGGSCLYLDTPLYLRDLELKTRLWREPELERCLQSIRKLDVLVSGIGGLSSLPTRNPAVAPYLTEQDRRMEAACIGSIYGRMLDQEGNEADTDLNRRVMAAEREDLLRTPVRMVVACGRHKVDVLKKAAEKNWFNVLVTDADTAAHVMESQKQQM